jgi:hypothetical protein
MIYMLCRNRVADYQTWRREFDSQKEASVEAGLALVKLWQSLDDPNNVFFLFKVDSLEKARAFISAPGNAEIGKAAGVLDGEIHFVVGD